MRKWGCGSPRGENGARHRGEWLRLEEGVGRLGLGL